jgi:hypothetical protein
VIDIDEALPEVLTHAPNVPEPVAIRYIREAAQYFCAETRIWREWEEFDITGDKEGDGISAFQDSKILEVEEAWLVNEAGEIKLEPITSLQLDRVMPRWSVDYDTVAGPACYVTQVQPNQVIVVPKAAGTLKARLVLAPSRKALTLPDFLIEDHAALIAKGAAANILLLPDVEYANPARGGDLRSEFVSETGRLKRKADKTQLKARQRVRSSFF